MTHISKEIIRQNAEVRKINPVDSKRMLVISLGTGIAKHEEKYNAATASQWGLIDWVYNDGHTPLIDIFSNASSDLVDYHVSTFFQSHNQEKNYLRIQVCNYSDVLL